MIVKAFAGHRFGANCYLVTDDQATAGVIIDPSLPYSALMAASGGRMPEIREIVLTHAHADHMLFLEEWRAVCRASVSVGALDAFALGSPEANCSGYLGLGQQTYATADRLLRNGDEIAVGDQRLRVIVTPGHTPGSLCLLFESGIITGDTLFAGGGVGRCDFFGGSEDCLKKSLSYLFRLPGSLTVYPGHGPATTIGQEAGYHSYLI
jgi:glyoxylase-like metal-dependent hydrolase (beta-lactamase superfamily II)